MRNSIKILIIILSLLLGINNIYSQSNLTATFSGRIKIDGIPIDSISFRLTKQFFYGQFSSRRLSFPCDSTGSFSIKIKLNSDLEKVDIGLHNTKNKYLTKHYVENGDQIVLDIDRSTGNVIFSGIGASKFNYREELNYYHSYKYLKKIYEDTTYSNYLNLKGYEAIEALKPLTNYLSRIDSMIIVKYKDDMSDKSLALIKEDLDGSHKKGFLGIIMTYYFNDKCRDKRIADYFNKNLPWLSDLSLNQYLKVQSEQQIEFLYQLTRSKLAFEKESQVKSIKEMYDRLKEDYQPPIQEHILIYYLLARPNGDALEYQQCLNDALETITNKDAIELLKQRLSISTPQKKMLDFSLLDTAQNIWNNNDLKGKVVLIDFWFTGCVYCRQLAESIDKEVLPKFKDDSNVLFVSINLDKDKQTWIKSVEQGVYTHQNSINLWTNGKAFNHPLIKHYEISGCPTLFVIDKEGNIINTNHSRNPSEIISTIEKTL